MMCSKGSNIKLNLRKDRIENFISKNFSGVESLSFNVNQLISNMIHTYVCAIDSKYWKRVIEITQQIVDGEINVCIKSNGLNMFYSVKSNDFKSMVTNLKLPSVLSNSSDEQPACVLNRIEEDKIFEVQKKIRLESQDDLGSTRSIGRQNNVKLAYEIKLPDKIDSPEKDEKREDNLNLLNKNPRYSSRSNRSNRSNIPPEKDEEMKVNSDL